MIEYLSAQDYQWEIVVADDGSEHRATKASHHSSLIREMLADADCGEDEPRVDVAASATVVRALVRLMDGEGGAWMEGLKRSDIVSLAEVAEFLMVEGEMAHARPLDRGQNARPEPQQCRTCAREYLVR